MKISKQRGILVGVAILFAVSSVLLVSGARGPAAEMLSGVSVALLPDGRILIAGGADAKGPVSSANVFLNGSLLPVAPLPTPRATASAVTLDDGRVMVTGGKTTGGAFLNSADIYDPASNTWSTVPFPLNEARAGHTTSLLPDGRIVVAGGETANGISQTVEVFDPSTGMAGLAGVLSVPRKSHAAAVLADGRVLIIGGSFGGPVPTASTDIFNPATDSVVPGPDMNVGRAGHSATMLPNGNVLVAGGDDGISELSSVEIYDATTGKFSIGDSLTTPRTGHSAFPLPDGGALVIGGTSATSEIYSTGLRLGGTPLIGNAANSAPDVVSQLLTGCSAGGSGENLLVNIGDCKEIEGASLSIPTTFDSSSTGTGVFEPIVRVQQDTTEQGYNTSGRPVQYDENTALNWTHDAPLNAVPLLIIEGIPFREFRLDLNESNTATARFISLDRVRMFKHNAGGVHAANPDLADFGVGATLVWDLDGGADRWVKMDANNFAGSGKGDMRLLIPNSFFNIAPGVCPYDAGTGPPCGIYVYLYSQFGIHYTSEGGFEEWSLRKVPYVAATKTANTSFTRTFPWSIQKVAAPTTWDLFNGDSGASHYTVTVTKGAPVDSAFSVSGNIVITNTSAAAAQITTVTDVISGGGGADIPVTPACPGGLPQTLASGATLTCTYTSSLPNANSRTNTATIVLEGGSGTTAIAAITFGAPTTTVNGTIHVTDSVQGSLGSFSDSGTAEYNRTFTCNTDQGAKSNTATITETGQPASASVQVNCYSLNVSKTASPSITRTFPWTITKTATPTTWALFSGDDGTSAYQIVATKGAAENSGFAVNGNITINNPAPVPATLTSVADVITSGLTATVNCPGAFPQVLAAGGTLTCTYSRSLPDDTTRTNTATASRRIFSYASNGTPTPGGTTDYSGTAPVDFAGAPFQNINDTVHITDTNSAGPQNVPISVTTTFNYNRKFFCPADAGTKTNTAAITETGQSASASVQVNCYVLDVSKTASPSITRTFPWTITKTANPATWTLFNGDDGTSAYQIVATKGAAENNGFAVNGNITINNPASIPATLTSVADVITGGLTATVNCPGAFPQALAAGGTLTCTYSRSLPDSTTRTNTATASRRIFSYASNGTPTAGGTTDYSGTAPVDFAGAPFQNINDTVHITDTNSAGPQNVPISVTTTFNYDRKFFCPADAGTKTNTAAITETGQTANASVTISCFAPTVTKTATPSFSRTWFWGIDKSVDQGQDNLMLSQGQLFLVNYHVLVNTTSFTDSAWAVGGTITISNPAPIPAPLASVTDQLAGPINAPVNCPSLTVPAKVGGTNGTLVCTYTASLPNAATRLNTATANVQNRSFPASGSPANLGTTPYQGTADAVFGAPTTLVDNCVTVNDNNLNPTLLGTVCVPGTFPPPSGASAAPHTFNYTLSFGTSGAQVPVVCGPNTHNNIATFETNTTHSTGQDNQTVSATVQCGIGGIGCTLTPGYWRTHNASFNGGAPPDDTWLINPPFPLAESTPFFLSGQTTFQVLWTAPNGNAYYNLSFQYIAALLNRLNGAATPADVLTAFNTATTLFNTYTPAQIEALKGNNPLRAQFISLADILGAYNVGLAPGGPPHCSEDGTSL